jgi:phosphatidylinositol glycan class B
LFLSKLKSINFYRFSFLLIAAIYIITAVNSSGWYHADEHYQIIEFAQFKLGNTGQEFLAWEYAAKIRPGFQPYLAFLFFNNVEFLGIENPYNQMIVLRIVFSLFILFVLYQFYKSTVCFISSEIERKYYFIFTFLFWFFPFLAARFSSEILSGAFMLLGLSYMLRSQGKISGYIVGGCFGLAFLSRYQIGFALIGVLIWWLINRRFNIAYFLKVLLAFMLVALFGVLIDFLFYGEFVLTTMNYLNTFFEGLEDNYFGTESIHWYFSEGYLWLTWPYGIAVLGSLLLLLILNRRSLALIVILVFLLIHTLIGHKEMRFLFPVVFLFPLLIFEAYGAVKRLLPFRVLKWASATFTVLFVVYGGMGILISATKGAGNAYNKITEYIHENYGNQKIVIYHTQWSQPYTFWGGDFNQYYKEQNISFVEVPFNCEFDVDSFKDNSVQLLAIRKEGEQLQECPQKDFIKSFEMQSIPGWIESILFDYPGFKSEGILLLYRISEY